MTINLDAEPCLLSQPVDQIVDFSHPSYMSLAEGRVQAARVAGGLASGKGDIGEYFTQNSYAPALLSACVCTL
jgi:hypothetical protein